MSDERPRRIYMAASRPPRSRRRTLRRRRRRRLLLLPLLAASAIGLVALLVRLGEAAIGSSQPRTVAVLARGQPVGKGAASRAHRVMANPIDVRPIKQDFRNNCETAALSMLLTSVGRLEGQVALQRRLPRDGPADPRTADDGTLIWGDPDRGFVGRVLGGGEAGGFGVYQAPILQLARRFAKPVDLTGRSASAIYARLSKGRAVMAWVGLSLGTSRSWRTEQGRSITVDSGEHTVLLVGVRGDSVLVNDPLDGKRKLWPKTQFELMWQRLNRRAVSA